MPAQDGDVSRYLVTHQGVDRVVLTGSYDTARLFRSWKPDMHLLGETSGKNAISRSRRPLTLIWRYATSFIRPSRTRDKSARRPPC